MQPSVPRRMLRLCLMTYLATRLVAPADWNPGDACQMHFPQLPDLSSDGVDMKDSDGITLADDFQWTEAGSVQGIHLWTSWRFDQTAEPVIEVGIWSDWPADSEHAYASPSNLLWTMSFNPSDYTARDYQTAPDGLWWLDPSGQEPSFPRAVSNVRQVNISVPEASAFTPEPGKTYWISVTAFIGDQYMMGWNTASNHWNEPAVWTRDQQSWGQLRYPPGHPFSPQGIDLAFVLSSSATTSAYDFADAPAPYPTLRDDDGPRHRLGGALKLGTDLDSESDGQPDTDALGDDNTGVDDEDGLALPSRWTPGLPAAYTVSTTDGGYLNAWVDFNQDGDWGDPGEQIADDTYVEAGTTRLSAPVPDTARPGRTFARFRISSQSGLAPTGPAPNGEVEDYALTIGSGCLTWDQPIDCTYGLGLLAYGVPGDGVHNQIADNWRADGRPIQTLMWWGSYLEWDGTPDLLPARPVGFRIRWMESVSGSTPDSLPHPGGTVRELYVPLLPYGVEANSTGAVSELRQCIADVGFRVPGDTEPQYAYYLALTEPWVPERDALCWLSIEAEYAEAPVANPWGWCTTPPAGGWQGAAMYANSTTPDWTALTYPPPLWPWKDAQGHPYAGQPAGTAFRFGTQTCPRRCVAWDQRLDRHAAFDTPSWRHVTAADDDPVAAADFVSDGRALTDVAWWGSYPGWQSNTWGAATNPVAPPEGDTHPLAFALTLFRDSGCAPGNVVTNFFIPAAVCHETYSACVTQTWAGGIFEHEYAYRIDLKQLEGDVPMEAGATYWLSIAAVFPDTFTPGVLHGGWGWALSSTNSGCASMTTAGVPPAWNPTSAPPGHPRAGQTLDLALQLLTPQVPLQAEVPVTFDSFTWEHTTRQAALLTSGDCGCGEQVLESLFSIRPGPQPWVPVATNVWPREVNRWALTVAGTSNTFYRVRLQDHP